jgi:FAD/FMN-containing dehydrogenase
VRHARSFAGKTVDCIDELVVMTYAGQRMVLGPCDDDRYLEMAVSEDDGGRIVRELRELRSQFAEEIRGGYPQISRRVSGYNLDQLLPENGFHLARSLVGTESTCAFVTEITVSLLPWPRYRLLVVLGYDDIYQAADNVPDILRHDLMGLEGFDGRLVEQMRRADLHTENLRLLPPGDGWLLAEVGASSEVEAEAKAKELVQGLARGIRSEIVRDHLDQERVWQIRESGLGATARPVGEPVNYGACQVF